MGSQLVELKLEPPVAVLAMTKPPVNAIDIELIEVLGDALAEVEGSPKAEALVLTGSGNSFSAGLDLKVVPTYDSEQQRRMIGSINRSIARLYSLSMPVVAAVNGHAIAGGLVLALACDYRIGSEEDFSLGLTETRAGIPFPAGPMTVVNAELTPAVARRLTLVARNSGPREAVADGILDELCPADSLVERASEFAADLASAGRSTYARVKAQLRATAISALNEIVDTGKDPLLDSWIGAEAKSSASALLQGSSRD